MKSIDDINFNNIDLFKDKTAKIIRKHVGKIKKNKKLMKKLNKVKIKEVEE